MLGKLRRHIRGDPVELLKRREVRKVVYFHTDHFEPWKYNFDDDCRQIEFFAKACATRDYARRVSLFYRPDILYRLDPSGREGRLVDGDFVSFSFRSDIAEGRARDSFAALRANVAHEFHIHVHHERWTLHHQPDDDKIARWVNANSTPTLDTARFDLYLRMCREIIARETGQDMARWSFIHGCWALNGSDPRICNIEPEIEILGRNGCEGDFSFPAGRPLCDPASEFPFTVGAVSGHRIYDSPVGNIRVVGAGGAFGTDRFLIWNSVAKHKHLCIDYYNKERQNWLKQTRECTEAWLAGSPVIDDTLYIKTHAHSVGPAYWDAGPLTIPHLHPSTVAIMESVQRNCDIAQVPLLFLSVNEVIDRLKDADKRVNSTNENAERLGPPFEPNTGPIWSADEALPDIDEAVSLVEKSWGEAVRAGRGFWRRHAIDAEQIVAGPFVSPSDIAFGRWISQTYGRETVIVQIGPGNGAFAALLAALGFRAFGAMLPVSARTAVNPALLAKFRDQFASNSVGGARRLSFPSGNFVDNSSWPIIFARATRAVAILKDIESDYLEANEALLLRVLGLFDEAIIDLTSFGAARRTDEDIMLLHDRIAARWFHVGDGVPQIADRHFARYLRHAPTPTTPERQDVAEAEPLVTAELDYFESETALWFLPELAKWISTDKDRIRGAGSTYEYKLKNSLLLFAQEQAFVRYANQWLPLNSQLVHVLGGFGEMALVLARLGFSQVVVLEAQFARGEGAEDLWHSARRRFADSVAGPRRLGRMIPTKGDLLTNLRLVQRRNRIAVCLDLVNSTIQEAEKEVLRVLSGFDTLIIDLGYFGRKRDADERRSFLRELEALGFEAVRLVYAVADYEIWHLQKNTP